ncbi:hypothetical protein [Kribbella flavida]|nr:hypothetical protein [Kribbella flavida]
MTGIVVLAVLVLAVVAVLESSHRRHSTGLRPGPNGSSAAGDRDLARSKLDLLALGGTAEPFTHKPVSTTDSVVHLRRARLHTPQSRPAA